MEQTWIGGTQCPLQRGFLRAAVVRSQRPHVPVRFDVHDLDTIGATNAAIPSVTIGRAPHRRWRPLKFNSLFDPGCGDRVVCACMPCAEDAVIASPKLFSADLLVAVQREISHEIAWCQNIGQQTGIATISDIAQRGSLVQEALTEAFSDPARTWVSVNRALGHAILGDLIRGVTIEGTGDYWNAQAASAHPSRFSVLDAFLRDAHVRGAYAALVGKPHEQLPYFVLFALDGYIVRSPLTVNGTSELCFRGQTLGTLTAIGNARALVEAVQACGYSGISLAPKAVPLYAQLRQDGILFGKPPKYLQAGRGLLSLLEARPHQYAKVRFDLAQALGRSRWRKCYGFIQNIAPSPSGWYGSASTSALSAGRVQYWKQQPTLIGLWLLGGRELVEATIATATIMESKSYAHPCPSRPIGERAFAPGRPGCHSR